MANTGWQICRSIVRVASQDNSKLLDRNGLQCDSVNPSGIPISASGLKQAAKVWNGVNVEVELVPGTAFTYSQYYDIRELYSVNTSGVPTSTTIMKDGAIVGRYRGLAGDSCPVTTTVVFSSSPQSAVLEPEGGLEGINKEFTVTSTVNGSQVEWTIQSYPSWMVVQKVNNTLLRISSFLPNQSSSTRYGTIVLTQVGTQETLSISCSQITNIVANRIFIQFNGTQVQAVAQFAVTSNVTLSIVVNGVTSTTLTLLSGSTGGTYYHNTTVNSVIINNISPSSDGTYTYSWDYE